MKILYIITSFLTIILFSCNKPPVDNPTQTKKVEDLIISESFDWNTTQNVAFSISSSESKVISITSNDGTTLYHQGFYNQLEETYMVNVNLPTTVTNVKINGVDVNITGEVVDVNLDTIKMKSISFRREFPTDGLVGLWHMDENTGTDVIDSQGGYNGVLSAANWTPGISNSGLDFDGVSGGVTIPENPGLNNASDELSISFWFKLNELGEDGCFVLYRTKYIVRIDKHGKVTFAIYNPTWNAIQTPWKDRIIDTDWHNVTVVYNGSVMELYIDNIRHASKATQGNLKNVQSNLYLGNQATQNFFGGIMDETALYDKALSTDEIRTIYITTSNPGTGTSSLVSWWPMDENGGTNVPDESGQNTGTAISAQWTTGVIGNCLDFDGANSYVSIPNHGSLNFSNRVTIMAWANTRDYKEAKIAQKGDWDGHGIGGSKWNGWKGHIRTPNGTESIEWTNGRPVLNQWYHIAITYDGSVLKMYINGQLNNSRNVTGVLNINSRGASIGSDNGGQKFFNGLIDEVKFFDEALTQTEIQAVYNGQSTTSDTDGDGIGDDEDLFPNDPGRAFVNYYPATGFGSLAFEDLWPGRGDYDFNDLVVDYRFEIITNASNKVSDIISKTVVRAIGAGFNNAYGFQFGNNQIQFTDITVTGYSHENNVVTVGENGLEANQSKPTIIVFDNAKNIISTSSGFGVNVVPTETFVEPDTVFVNIAFTPDVYSIEDLDLINFNPFIIVDGVRGKEIHLPNYPPTDLADITLFGTDNDDSQPSIGRYYKTVANLPWAINIAESYDYSIEKSQIISAYTHFGEWAESSGNSFPDWYKDLSGNRNEDNIYQVPNVK